jgi:signal transduction histidine kinase
VVFVGGLVFLAWILDVRELKTLPRNEGSMKANSALAFAAAGLSLALLRPPGAGAGRRRLGNVLALLVAAVGALTLLEYASGWDLRIDELLFKDTEQLPATKAGQMGLNTAVDFLLAGAALLLLDRRPVLRVRASDACVVVAAWIAFLALAGHIYGAPGLTALPSTTRMALHTSAVFLVLAYGILVSRPNAGLTGLVTSGALGGTMMRRLLLPVTVVPVIVGWLRLEGQRNGLYSTGQGVALLVVSLTTVLVVVLFVIARQIDRSDRERQAVFDQMPGGLVIASASSRTVTFSNATAIEVIGRNSTGGGVTGDGQGRAFHLDGRPYRADEYPLGRTLGAGETIADEQVVYRRADGERIVIELSSAPIFDQQAKVVSAVLTFKDVTAERAAQDEVRRLNAELEDRVRQRTRELEAVNKELEAFSYSVSHDLRAPLRAIDGFSRILLDELAPQIPADGQRYLHLVRGGAQEMGVLIDGLLSFSRLGHQALSRRPTETTELAQDVIETFDAEQSERNVVITLQDLPAVEADETLLRQVFVNLLANALKYSRHRDPARIEVGTYSENGRAVFYVRDNGAGFDMRYADKLFRVFQRLHRTEDYEGTGLGLALVERIVTRHGGRIWAESKPDAGATFYFTLEGATER